MRLLIRVDDGEMCKSCKYAQPFGSQPGSKQKEAGETARVCCNYLLVNERSRIFEDGKMAYDPAYCDKYEEGDRVSDKRKFAIFTLEHDEYYDYKCQKIRHEVDVKRRRECK